MILSSALLLVPLTGSFRSSEPTPGGSENDRWTVSVKPPLWCRRGNLIKYESTGWRKRKTTKIAEVVSSEIKDQKCTIKVSGNKKSETIDLGTQVSVQFTCERLQDLDKDVTEVVPRSGVNLDLWTFPCHLKVGRTSIFVTPLFTNDDKGHGGLDKVGTSKLVAANKDCAVAADKVSSRFPSRSSTVRRVSFKGLISVEECKI